MRSKQVQRDGVALAEQRVAAFIELGSQPAAIAVSAERAAKLRLA